MWIFTRYGFFSIAAAKTRKGTNSSRTIMVRARQRRHLENLASRFPILQSFDMAHGGGTDYRHRIVIPKAVWIKVLTELAKEQTWSNFKGETESFLGSAFDDYVRALHRVWSIMGDLQTNEPILLTREMLEGIRDFCLVRLRQMEETSDYSDRIALGRAFRTWQEHFGLPNGAADLAYRIAAYWYKRAEMAERLELPEEYQEFLRDAAKP